jgi:hypothetical protein
MSQAARPVKLGWNVPANLLTTGSVTQPQLEFMPRKAQKRKVGTIKQSPSTADAIVEESEFEAEAIQDFREIAKQRQYLYLLSRVCHCKHFILYKSFLLFPIQSKMGWLP